MTENPSGRHSAEEKAGPAGSDLIWLRPEPSERRPRLRREQITAAALRIADAEGFESVTMKRIAAELGVGTMTLYYYVRTKADVVALMQDAILGGLLIPDDELPADWREAVTAIARRTRDVLIAHPWSVSSFNETQFGPNAMRHIEQSLAALDRLDVNLDPAAKLSLWAIVDDYVSGSVLHTVETLSRIAQAQRDPRFAADAIAFGRQQLATGRFPRLAALDQQLSPPDQNAQAQPPAADAAAKPAAPAPPAPAPPAAKPAAPAPPATDPPASAPADAPAPEPATPDPTVPDPPVPDPDPAVAAAGQLAAQFERGLTALLDGLTARSGPGGGGPRTPGGR
jgi:AcrR family transcriptional regulator